MRPLIHAPTVQGVEGGRDRVKGEGRTGQQGQRRAITDELGLHFHVIF